MLSSGNDPFLSFYRDSHSTLHTRLLTIDPLVAVAVFVIGIATGAVGAMVGGGSMISIPFLIFLGIPADVAVATDRLAGLGAGTSAFIKYRAARKIAWRHVPTLTLTSLVGALIGATLLIVTSADVVQTALGVLLIALLPVVFFNRKLGIVSDSAPRNKVVLGVALYFFVQVLAGFFGAGTGTLIFLILMSCFGLRITEAAATQVIPFLVLTISTVVLFAANDIIDYPVAIALLVGTLVGGYVGAHTAVTKGDVWIRRLFAVVVLASALRLLWPDSWALGLQ